MACGFNDPSACLQGVVGGVGKKLAVDAFEEIAQSFATAAEEATKWLWRTMGQATAVRFGGVGWQRDMGITVSLALIVGVGLFLIQVIASAVRQDFGGMGRAVRGMFIAWGAGGAAITITESLLYVADQLSQGIMQAGAGTSSWEGLGQKVLAASAIASLAGSEAAAAVILLLSLVIVAASVIVWAALMVRKLLLIISAVLAPVAFSGAQADVTFSWVRKWIELTVALIASKIILVVIFVVGLGVLDEGLGHAPTHAAVTGHVAQGATQVVVGALILSMAGFAPWLALKMAHFAGDSFHAVHTHAQGVGQGARAAAQVPQKFRSTVQGGQWNPLSRSSSSGSSSSAGGRSPAAIQSQSKGHGVGREPGALGRNGGTLTASPRSGTSLGQTERGDGDRRGIEAPRSHKGAGTQAVRDARKGADSGLPTGGRARSTSSGKELGTTETTERPLPKRGS